MKSELETVKNERTQTVGERPHKRLVVWQKAMELVKHVYSITGAFPAEERFGLVLQMRRAAVSIVCNLAEGAARRTHKEKRQFFSTAAGSTSELDAQMEICGEVGLISKELQQQSQRLVDHVARLLSGLMRSLTGR